MPSHDEFDDFLDDDDDAPVVDTRADGRLYRVPLKRLSPNKVNPRTEFGTDDELIDFGKSLARRQNQACPVVSRGAYLKLWPEHAEKIGNVDYVLVSGERRYRAADKVGLAALDCVVNDDVAQDRKTFMEAVVSENVDRQNFDAIEEAYAVQALVSEFGTNRAVAQHFERADGWVTQRVLLTHLAPNMQTLVRRRAIPLEWARKLGKLARDEGLSAEQQAQWWTDTRKTLMAQAAGKKAEKKAATEAATSVQPTGRSDAQRSSSDSQPGPEGSPAPAGRTPEPAPQAPQEQTQPPAGTEASAPEEPPTSAPVSVAETASEPAESFTAVKPDGQETARPTEQEDKSEPPEVPVKWMPWHSPIGVLRICREHMKPSDFEQLVKEAQAQL